MRLLGLFGGLGEADIAALAEVSFGRRLARGQVLFLAGEPSEHRGQADRK